MTSSDILRKSFCPLFYCFKGVNNNENPSSYFETMSTIIYNVFSEPDVVERESHFIEI
jgi:hypothetical protein